MSTVLFPSLSTDGFVEDRNIIIRKLLEMFVACHENQSVFYNTKSYKYIVNTFEPGFYTADEIKKALESMYGAYFDSSTINVDNEYKEEEAVFLYSISITATYHGVTYNLSKTISESIVIRD